MADGEEGPPAQQARGVGVRVEIGDVGDVVALLLHPEGQRKLPEQELAGALRERRIEDLPVLAIGPIEADGHAGPGVPVVRRRAVIVERPQVRPAIVRRPGRVRALEQKVALPLIADDEDDIALQLLALRL